MKLLINYQTSKFHIRSLGIDNFVPHVIMGVNTYQCWDWSYFGRDDCSHRPMFTASCLMNTGIIVFIPFCEARRASHCHSPQTTFSSNSTCCVLSTQKSAMHVVVYADRLTTQHSIVDIVHWSWSYWQFCYPRWHVECFWAALAAHWISSASHTSVLPQHPRRKIVPYRVGWNHHTSDYYG